jgi:hypothetical protein
VQIWSYHYPANEVPWPGNSGTITRVPIPKNRYLAEQFVVPTDGSVTDQIQWVFANSGANSNFSLSVSICPGDFGQTGTQTTSASCIRGQAQSSSGLYGQRRRILRVRADGGRDLLLERPAPGKPAGRRRLGLVVYVANQVRAVDGPLLIASLWRWGYKRAYGSDG